MLEYPEEFIPFKRTHLNHDTRLDEGADEVKRFWGVTIIARYIMEENSLVEAKIERAPITQNHFVICGEEKKNEVKKVVDSEEEARNILFSWMKQKKMESLFY